jgi:hypothetical protein
MCKFISGVAVLADGQLKVYTLRDTDSHVEIYRHHKIRDDGSPGATRQTPVELIPVKSLERVEDMEFMFDDQRPDWWTDEHTEQAKAQLFSAMRERWDGDTLRFKGDLYLSFLTSLPANAKLSAGGDLYLRSLTSLPANAKLSAGGDLYLSFLTSLPANAKLSAGGDLDLSFLTSLPAGETLDSIRAAVRKRWQQQKARTTVGG